jgi:uncharacterized protein DUF2834
MTSRERALLALTIVGVLVPNTMVFAFVIEHGLDFSGYFSHWGESLPAAQLAADVSISFLAFALPLFLLLRERAVREQPSDSMASDGPGLAR